MAKRQVVVADIRALLSAHRKSIDWERLRSYFALFGRESMLEELLREAGREGD